MTDHPSSAKFGLTDAELAVHPTVFGNDAFKDQVVVVSGGAGGIGRAIGWLVAYMISCCARRSMKSCPVTSNAPVKTSAIIAVAN